MKFLLIVIQSKLIEVFFNLIKNSIESINEKSQKSDDF